MKNIFQYLAVILALITNSVYAQSNFEQYLKLFPELSLPYDLNKEKMNALKKQQPPIPKEYMLFTTSVKMRASAASSYEYMTYYPIGKITLSDKLVVLFIFDNTG